MHFRERRRFFLFSSTGYHSVPWPKKNERQRGGRRRGRHNHGSLGAVEVAGVEGGVDRGGAGIVEVISAGDGEVFIEGGVTPLTLEDQGERSNLQNEMEGAEEESWNGDGSREGERGASQRERFGNGERRCSVVESRG